MSRRAPRNTFAGRFIFISQHFGTGVLIATAFVHLLPTAFVSLGDPCLPHFFSDGYRPLPGLIGMFSVLVVVALEMFLTTRGARHSHSHGGDWDAIPEEDTARGDGDNWEHGADEESHSHTHMRGQALTNLPNGSLTVPNRTNGSNMGRLGRNHRPKNIALGGITDSDGLMAGASPLPTSTPPAANGKALNHNYENNKDEDEDSDLEIDFQELTPRPLPSDNSGPNTPKVLTAEDEQKRQILQCLLLEAGILFHSIFIGMAVSVATGPPFVVFLIAIAFHQSFEGLALGSRIAAINFPSRSPRPWLMVLAYGTTTPIGQAIGLFVHNLYDPHSAAGLLMVGFMNAISSGLLLFAGLVQLLSEDFLSDKSYSILKGRRRWEAYSAVIGGALLMSLVGAWA